MRLGGVKLTDRIRIDKPGTGFDHNIRCVEPLLNRGNEVVIQRLYRIPVGRFDDT